MAPPVGPTDLELSPDVVNVVPPRRCRCSWRRRTLLRCAGCGRPGCFHCLTPPRQGGRCQACLGAPRVLGRGHHAAIALVAVVLSAAIGGAWAASLFPDQAEATRSLVLDLLARVQPVREPR